MWKEVFQIPKTGNDPEIDKKGSILTLEGPLVGWVKKQHVPHADPVSWFNISFYDPYEFLQLFNENG